MSDVFAHDDLPEGWEPRRLKTVAELRTSNVDKNKVEGERPVRLCNYTDVYYSDRIADTDGLMEATATQEEILRFRLRRGDVLVTKDSETADDIAVPAFVARDFNDVLCGYHLAILRPRDGLDGRYLYYALLTDRVGDQFAIGANGITRFGLSQSVLKDAVVPLPPFPTQRAIASFLDRETTKIDTLIEKKQRLIELLDEKRTALITRAVTRGLDPDVPMKDSGVEWIGEIPEHWAVTTLNRITSSSRPIRYGIVLPGPHDEDGVPIIKAGDVARLNGRVGSLRRCAREIEEEHRQSRVFPGDLIYSIRGSFGAVNRVPETLEVANLTQDTARVVPDGVSGQWLLHMLRSEAVKRQLEAGVKGTAVKGVNIEDLRRAITSVPPRPEQEAIAEYLDKELEKLKAVREHVTRAVDLLKEYRTALISAAATGQVDINERPHA